MEFTALTVVGNWRSIRLKGQSKSQDIPLQMHSNSYLQGFEMLLVAITTNIYTNIIDIQHVKPLKAPIHKGRQMKLCSLPSEQNMLEKIGYGLGAVPAILHIKPWC